MSARHPPYRRTPPPHPPSHAGRLARAVAATLLLCTVAVPTNTLSAQAPTPRFLGFDRNDFPGVAALPLLRRTFSFVGFWLNPPPEAHATTWAGHRQQLAGMGFGFLVLWNGRLDADLLSHAHRGTAPQALGRADAALAISAARREGFPSGTILFLDQEEGGRLLEEQAGYLLAWTEAVASSTFRPGVYASGQPVSDAPGTTITTAADITARVRSGHLHPVALWVAQDSCGPSPGCTLTPPPLERSGTPGALVWQFAQSPRRPAVTRSCARTYTPAGTCIVSGLPALFLDLNVSSTPDPSHGR